MQQNKISMVITQQDEDSVEADLTRIEATLKGLITLGAEDRRKIRMMGPKRADFARAVIRTLQQNPQLAPSGLDVAGAQADLDALDRMRAYPGTAGVPGHHIGDLMRLTTAWSPSKALTLNFIVEHLTAGSVLARAGLESGTYAQFGATYRY